jgi:hypothetical protein
MGGLVCEIHKNAVITDPNSDAQWRQLFSITDVAQAVVNDTPSADKLCTVLAKPAFTAADKLWFGQLVASLWVGYS